MIKTLDYDCIQFNVITVEADGGNPEKDAAVVAFLVEKGYEHHGRKGQNDWFVRKGFVPSRQP